MLLARTHLGWLLSLSVIGASQFAVGCGSGDDGGGGGNGAGEVDNGFESDDPSGQSAASRGGSFNASDAGTAAPSASEGASSDPSGDAARTVEEADIIKQDGNRLYALSRYGGLAVVDITDPDHMKVLGRKRTEGMPFEMYVRNGRAYVMFNDFGRYVVADGNPYGQWVQSSEITALDVTNPAAISEFAHYDVPGSIADSRVVGDALYLVTYENGYCWNCNTKPSTVVTSFNIAGAGIGRVDQLAFSSPNANYSSWQRSVTATNQRLYIAGPEWNWTAGSTNGQSVIQVIDITDPGGHLVKGVDLPVAGQINSRWQMDEFNGVLRVVSQFGNGFWGPNNSVNPLVQTFTVSSASSITPLGQTELQLPKPESLRSVRFDGTRGYAITAEQKDPLFTIDLADPAHPVQAGELVMPGWVLHMEPRGDRLIGFGYDDTMASQANLAVSLFDVSDLTKPTMLERVSFGAGWGSFAEDQDRIHKSVSVLDDDGLILVPFASYGRWDGTNCAQPESGIQLIDYSHDHLTKRGLAPQYGLPRRAFLANGRMLAVSDRNVTSFDIGVRDNPVKKHELDMSNPAYRMVEVGDSIASISSDWWSGEVMLSLTPKANADDSDTSGKVSLATLAAPGAWMCNGGGWTSWYQARLFANGNTVYLSVPVYTYDGNVRGGKIVLAAIDVSNPAQPVIVSKSEMTLTNHDMSNGYYGWYGEGFWDDYAFYSYYGGVSGSLVGTGEAIVQLGSKLAFIEVDNEWIPSPGPKGTTTYSVKVHRKLHVADFASATAPTVHAPIELAESLGSSPLNVIDGVVMTSRWNPSPKNPDKVRFFVDRIDINGSTPVQLPSINTPGSLVMTDEPSHRMVTSDYKATRTKTPDWQACQTTLGWRAYFDYNTNDCILVDRSLKLSDIQNTKVTLRQTFNPPSQNFGGVRVADDRIYVTRYARYDYSQSYVSSDGKYLPPTLIEDGGLWAIGGIRAGQLSIVSQMNGDAQWPLAANGTKVALYTQGGLAIYDTATPVPTKLTEQNLRGWGYTSHVLLGQDRAICSLAEWGLQTVHF